MPHQCTGCGHAFEDGSKEMLSGCPECGGNTFQFRPEGAPLPEEPEQPEGAEPAADPPEREDRSSVAERVGRATTRVRDFVAPEEQADPPDPDAAWPSETESESGAAGTDPAAPDREPTETGPKPDSRREPDPNREPEPDSGSEIIDADARREAHGEDLAQTAARNEVRPGEELTATGGSQRDAEKPGPEEATDGSPAVDSEGRVVSEPTDEEPDLSELREQLNDQFESIRILEPGQYELNLMELYDREEYIIALQENGRYVIQVPEQWMGEDPSER